MEILSKVTMSIRVKEEQFSDNEDDQVEVKPNIHRVDVKAEEPAEYLLIIPPKEESKEQEEENEDQVITTKTTASEDRGWKCDHFDCDYVGKTKKHLLQHQRTHTKLLECKDCDKRFSRKNELKRHRLVKHENPNAFQCKVCKKNLSNKNSLRSHLKAHEENQAKPFKCLKCQKTFRMKRSLQSHQKYMHSTFKPFACDLCPKTFSVFRQIRIHVETHKIDKKFKCEVCSRSFAYKANFDNHMERHAGIKFKCDLCNAECLTEKALRNHKNGVHANQSLKCDKCDYVGKHPILLKLHQQSHKEWTEADVVECLKCKRNYRNKFALDQHIKNVHSELQFECDFINCNYVGETNYKLKHHRRIHDEKFKCNICDKNFTNKCRLVNHNLIKHEEPDRFKCHICDKRLSSNYSLRGHLKTHESEKKFNCQQCSKSFLLNRQLECHQLNVHGKSKMVTALQFFICLYNFR